MPHLHRFSLSFFVLLSRRFISNSCSLTPILVCVISLSLLFTSSDAKSNEPSDLGCEGSTLEQHGCMTKLLSEADKELNTAYQSLIRLARNHGEEWVQDLRAAQRKWVEYRDLNCEFYGNYLKGGSGEGLYFGACKIRMTRERTVELQKERQKMIGRGYQEKN